MNFSKEFTYNLEWNFAKIYSPYQQFYMAEDFTTSFKITSLTLWQ